MIHMRDDVHILGGNRKRVDLTLSIDHKKRLNSMNGLCRVVMEFYDG